MFVFDTLFFERIAQTRLCKMVLRATVIGAVCVSTISQAAQISEPKNLTLNEALQKSLSYNPQLLRFPFAVREAEALRLQASLRATPTLTLSVANALGSDNFSGFDSAEITLGLSQLIELGDKRQARVGLSDARWQSDLANYEIARLEVLAETGRRYYALLNTQTLAAQLSERAQLEQSALKIIEGRVKAGAVGAADAAKMQLKLGQTELQLLQLKAKRQQQKSELANLWLSEANYAEVEGNLLALPTAINIAQLLAKLEDSPLIQQKIRLSHLATAQVTKEQSLSHSDITVGLGVRDFQASNAQALVFDVSIPLSVNNPNRGNLAAAYSRQQWADEAQALERRELQLRLKSLALNLHNQRLIAETLNADLLPKARTLLSEVERGYQRGIYSVLQWIDAQSELFSLKHQQVQLHTNIVLQRLEIERISGQSLEAHARIRPSSSKPEA